MQLPSNEAIGPTNGDSGDKNYEIIPAVNLFKGMPMVKVNDGYEPLMDSDGGELNIKDLISQLKGRFEKLLFTDINGINRDKPQLNIIRSSSSEMELWVDAGSRYGDGVIDILVAGAHKVVLATKTLRNLDELDNAANLSENIILGIDYDEGIVSPKNDVQEMSPLNLTKIAKNAGLSEIIFTDLRHLDSNTGFNEDVGNTLLDSDMDIYFHGRFEREMETYKRIGLAGVIIEVETLL